MKKQIKGFTLVELLVVVSIIAVLVGIIVPAINMARMQAKKGALKSTLNAISTGLDVFRNDFGNYPDSSIRDDVIGSDYYLRGENAHWDNAYTDVGAHRLAEAMFGIDLLGHSTFQPNGIPFYHVNSFGVPCDNYENEVERTGPYVSLDNLEIGTMGDVPEAPGMQFDACIRSAGTVESVQFSGKFNSNPLIMDGLRRKLPRPILYYRAHKRGTFINTIYNYDDNHYITDPFGMQYEDKSTGYTYTGNPSDLKSFPNFIWDQKTGIGTTPADRLNHPSARPYNSDTFILVSAGPDGEYGTEDDITNFSRRD